MKLFYRLILSTINASLNYLKQSDSNKKVIEAVEDYYESEYNKAIASLKLVNSLGNKMPELKLIETWHFSMACQQIVRFPNLSTQDIFNNMLIEANISKEDREMLLKDFNRYNLSLNEKSN